MYFLEESCVGQNSFYYKNMPMQCTEIFKVVKNENFQQIFFLYLHKTLILGTREAVLTSTHNLCFGSKIRKIGIPLLTPFLLYKSGVRGGLHFTDMFS